MTSVSDATDLILTTPLPFDKKKVTMHESVGLFLAEDIFADRDLPPYHRATMDGIALQSKAVAEGRRSFTLEGVQAAGMAAMHLSQADKAIEIMTGAVLPSGADCVVRYEDVKIENGVAQVLVSACAAYANVHLQGADAKAGAKLLAKGTKISAAEVAVMASVGKTEVDVLQVPPVAIVSTGDELIDPQQKPEQYQIRRSNDVALQAALREMMIAADCFHLADKEEVLEEQLKNILDHYPIVILSGGVSKGKFDFVPQVLQKLGVQKVFHQVSQKPGKPFWFGRAAGRVVFALPGNPVSTLLCFYRYVKPWLLKGGGHGPVHTKAVLADDVKFAQPLTYFVQVNVTHEQGKLLARPVAGGGSGDFVNLAAVDGFLELPAGADHFQKGEIFDFIAFRS